MYVLTYIVVAMAIGMVAFAIQSLVLFITEFLASVV